MQAAINLQEYYRSPEWMALRDVIQERCNNRCERCGKAKMTHVVHVSWDRKGCELPEDLLGICRTCHKNQFANKILPHRNYRNFLTLTEIGEKIGVTVPKIRKQLLSRRFVIPHTHGFGGRKTMYIPTDKAFIEGVCYKKMANNGSTMSGVKGTWKWDIEFIRYIMGK